MVGFLPKLREVSFFLIPKIPKKKCFCIPIFCQGGRKQLNYGGGQDGKRRTPIRTISQTVSLLAPLIDSFHLQVGGVRSIPFMQVLLMLSTDLDGSRPRDSAALDKLLSALVDEIEEERGATSGSESIDQTPSERSRKREFQLVVLRLFSVLMSR